MSSSTLAMIIGLLSVGQKAQSQLFISENAEQHLTQPLLDSLAEHIQNTHDVITTTSALPGNEDNAQTVARARKNIDSSIFETIKTSQQIPENVLFKLICKGIKLQAAGNCQEFVVYARSLFPQGVPSEIYRAKGTEGSHVFLVINRDRSTPADDFTQWNADAIIVDPYLKMIYLANEIPILLQICVHDTQKNVIHYILFNPQKHTLDNNIRTELLEDWQNVIQSIKENRPPDVNISAAQRDTSHAPKTSISDKSTEADAEQHITFDSSWTRG